VTIVPVTQDGFGSVAQPSIYSGDQMIRRRYPGRIAQPLQQNQACLEEAVGKIIVGGQRFAVNFVFLTRAVVRIGCRSKSASSIIGPVSARWSTSINRDRCLNRISLLLVKFLSGCLIYFQFAIGLFNEKPAQRGRRRISSKSIFPSGWYSKV
jgi:hypothetical protein